MKRLVVIILTLFLFLINTIAEAAPSLMKKEIKAVSTDGFNISATLTYPKIKNRKTYSTVILLHSLGYNSQWWEDLPKELLDRGYAVLAIDLRGHGESVYNSRLVKTSWKNLKNTGYAKYPQDIVAVVNKVKEENSKLKFFDNYAVVGADIGAASGVIAVDNLGFYPKTFIMISPVVKSRGLYIPVSMAHLDGVDFLSISGTDDIMSKEAENYLMKFAQNEFVTFTSDSKSTGMLMLKNDPSLSKMLAEWIFEYLN